MKRNLGFPYGKLQVDVNLINGWKYYLLKISTILLTMQLVMVWRYTSSYVFLYKQEMSV